MHETYGKDERSLIAGVKQKPNEPVRVFATRLQSSLNILGWCCPDPTKPNLVSLDDFLNGLLPTLSSEVRKMLPRGLDIAIDYVEGLKSTTMISDTNTNRNFSDKLTPLSAQITRDNSLAIKMIKKTLK